MALLARLTEAVTDARRLMERLVAEQGEVVATAARLLAKTVQNGGIVSNDFTAQSQFSGDFDRFANKKIQNGKINMIPGIDVGIKTVDDNKIFLDDLMSNNYLKLYPQTYGIWIPADQILSRRKYEWF